MERSYLRRVLEKNDERQTFYSGGLFRRTLCSMKRYQQPDSPQALVNRTADRSTVCY